MLANTNWHIWQPFPGSNYTASRLENHNERLIEEISAHCLACAKSSILVQYGGRVDLRGHNNDGCANFLKAMQAAVKNEEQENA